MKLNKKILKNKYESGVEDRNEYHVKKRVNLSGGPPDECLHGAPPTIKKLKTAADRYEFFMQICDRR